MAIVLGIDGFHSAAFTPVTARVRSINYAEMKNGIYDQLSIYSDADESMEATRDTIWTLNMILNALFKGNLEAGNVQNSGLVINGFSIKRRKLKELINTTLGYIPFNLSEMISFIDYMQGVGDYVYSLVPISDQLEGLPNEIQVNSRFSGWFIVDKDTGNVLALNKYVDSEPTINLQLNQGRKPIEGMTKYPDIWYDVRQYHSFTLTGLIYGDEYKTSGEKYEDAIEKFVQKHTPMIVKSGGGKIYVADVSGPKASEPSVNRLGKDYMMLSLDITEIADYDDYMAGVAE